MGESETEEGVAASTIEYCIPQTTSFKVMNTVTRVHEVTGGSGTTCHGKITVWHDESDSLIPAEFARSLPSLPIAVILERLPLHSRLLE